MIESTHMSLRTRILISLALGAGLGALLSALSAPAPFWPGWFSFALLCGLSAYFLLLVAQQFGGGRTLAWLVALAFITRLAVGVGLSLALPMYGFDEPEQNAGYHFYDAYGRDMQAWDLATSGRPLTDSLMDEFSKDQYGGLLGISAAVYRYMSPDAHRPFLILVLGAFTTALGVAFFWEGMRRRWGLKLAALASWILVLYPDAIFFGSSQMREPFLLGLTGIAFWGVIEYASSRRRSLIALAVSLALMALISSRVAVVIAVVLGVWFWLEYLAQARAWRIAGIAALSISLIAAAAGSWVWLQDSAHWDMLTTLSTGRALYDLQSLGEQFKVPFIIGYGIAQPVLPAAIADSTLPIWKVIILARSAGWYLLAPFLLYAFFTSLKARPGKERAIWVLFSVAVLVWLMVSAFRAGGDMTDNPRYRSMFLPWMALLAGWGLLRALETRDLWLARWLAVEAIFLGFFTSWYISRYFGTVRRMPFNRMVITILLLSGVVLASGWLWDLGKRARSRYNRLKQLP